MVNEVVFNYLKAHAGRYPIEALKKRIISRGYSEAEFREALDYVANPHKKIPQPLTPLPNQTIKQPISPQQTNQQTVLETKKAPIQVKTVKKAPIPKQIPKPKKIIQKRGAPRHPPNFVRVEPREEFKGFKWIKLGAICGAIFSVMVLGLLAMMFFPNLIGKIILFNAESSGILYLFIGILIIFFLMNLSYLFAFIKVGKYSRNKFLKVISLIQFISYIVLIGFSISLPLILNMGSAFMFANSPNLLFSEMMILTYILIGLNLIMLVTRYLFSIGLIKNGVNVDWSKSAGWLGLVSIFLVTLILGFYIYTIVNFTSGFSPGAFSVLSSPAIAVFLNYLPYIVYSLTILTLILETISLFSASKKYEVRE